MQGRGQVQAGAIGAEAVRQDDAALSTVRLSAFGLRRDPPRPAADRRADYERLFDYDTLFYDVFRAAAADEVICSARPRGCSGGPAHPYTRRR